MAASAAASAPATAFWTGDLRVGDLGVEGYEAEVVGARERNRWTATWERSSAAGTRFSLPVKAMATSSALAVVAAIVGSLFEIEWRVL